MQFMKSTNLKMKNLKVLGWIVVFSPLCVCFPFSLYHLGIYIEDLVFFDTNKIMVFEDFFLKDFGFIYNPRTFKPKQIHLILIWFKMLLAQYNHLGTKDSLILRYSSNIDTLSLLQDWY